MSIITLLENNMLSFRSIKYVKNIFNFLQLLERWITRNSENTNKRGLNILDFNVPNIYFYRGNSMTGLHQSSTKLCQIQSRTELVYFIIGLQQF